MPGVAVAGALRGYHQFAVVDLAFALEWEFYDCGTGKGAGTGGALRSRSFSLTFEHAVAEKL